MTDNSSSTNIVPLALTKDEAAIILDALLSINWPGKIVVAGAAIIEKFEAVKAKP